MRCVFGAGLCHFSIALSMVFAILCCLSLDWEEGEIGLRGVVYLYSLFQETFLLSYPAWEPQCGGRRQGKGQILSPCWSFLAVLVGGTWKQPLRSSQLFPALVWNAAGRSVCAVLCFPYQSVDFCSLEGPEE